ncbi:hypothetical protein [Maritalea mediterranea]|uniref:Flagellar protein FlgN n=1 Tax=Maritalea mediterranea TaxID=2909667 RepID=A0ABS9E7G7_9HYPH|nr:hypothetical protein [Maritalea mediterranea]MCF4098825.1 hypothetical protein [Maritalea mediterranea]
MTPHQLRAQTLAKKPPIPLPGEPEEVCIAARDTLTRLVDIMNNETTLLRAGRLLQASELAAPKAELAQKYVGLARAIQHNVDSLKQTAPHLLEELQKSQTALATQMAENMRVLATAKSLSEEIVGDVAAQLGRAQKPKTYGGNGVTAQKSESLQGVSINKTS